jgi:EAL and modified HD-GYP domain-containing signal transduction protein
MEKLVLAAKPALPTLAEQAFMVGIMSAVPAMLDIRMEEVLAQLRNLPAAVHGALLERQGYLGKLLTLVENLEQKEIIGSDPLEQFTTDYGAASTLRPAALNWMHCEAMAWAARLGQPQPKKADWDLENDA